jgi:hypothetical protein
MVETTQTITWSSAGNIGSNVSVALYKGATLMRTIAESIPTTTGTVNWGVGELQDGDDYTVRVTSLTDGRYWDATNTPFRVRHLWITAPTRQTSIRVGDALEKAADGFLALLAIEPEFVEPFAAGIARRPIGCASGILDAARTRANEAGFSVCSRQQRRDQRSGRKTPSKRDQWRFRERIDGAVPRALIGFDCALARTGVLNISLLVNHYTASV